MRRRCRYCSADLGRYSADDVCRQCQAARNELPARTGVTVPPDLLVDPAVLRALDSWAWDVVLRQVSARTGLTQQAIAAASGDAITQQQVSRIMAGSSRPSIDTVRALCDGLGIPRDLAGLAPRPGDGPTSQATSSAGDMFEGLGAAAAVAFMPAADLPEPLASDDAESAVQQLRTAGPKLLAANDQQGGTPGLRRIAAKLVRDADGLLQHGLPGAALTHQTQTVAGNLAMTAGWLYYDGGDQESARGYWQHALYQAQLADDPVIEVFALASLAVQATFLLNRPREAVWLAQRARTVAKGWASPCLESMLYMREACGWAAQHDDAEFQRALRHAYNLHEPMSEGDPPWLSFYGHGELAGLTGLAYVEMRRYDKAEPLLRQATGEVGPQLRRNQIYYASTVGRAISDKGDLAGAAEWLAPNLDVIASSGSWRARRHVGKVASAAAASRSPRALAFADAARDAGIMT